MEKHQTIANGERSDFRLNVGQWRLARGKLGEHAFFPLGPELCPTAVLLILPLGRQRLDFFYGLNLQV